MRLIINLFREVLKWDRPSQIALAIAVSLLIFDLTILSTQDELQTPALIGAVGLIITIQVIFMWGNRNLVTEITQAQRHMLSGDFQAAVDTLLSYIDSNRSPDLQAFALLGNSYRNLGQLDESEKWLQQSLNKRVNDHFALYGLGKTALAKGDYQYAVDHFEESLMNGGHQTAYFDIALAYFMMNDMRRAADNLKRMPESDDINRQLFAAYMLHKAGETDGHHNWQVEGLPFWQAEIERFHHTPYGQAMAGYVKDIEKRMS